MSGDARPECSTCVPLVGPVGVPPAAATGEPERSGDGQRQTPAGPTAETAVLHSFGGTPVRKEDQGHGKYVGLKNWGWYLNDLHLWRERFGSDERRRVLEVGAFDGVSANRMLDAVFRHSKSEVHCIDAFLPDPTTPQVGEQTKGQFEENARLGEHERQIYLYEGLSAEVLAWMLAEEGFWESFDFIYVDGSHQARHVLMDATMSWNLLRVGGVIIFDDYEWPHGENEYGRPRTAIDAFETVFSDRLQRVLSGYRRGFGKLSA